MPAGLDGNPNPIITTERRRVIDATVDAISKRRHDSTPLLVAIDGIDGAGKSTFADEVADACRAADIPVVRSTIDSFHRPRADRHARGATSPVGFYLDSHDLDTIRTELLTPFRNGGTARLAAFDEPSDRPVLGPEHVVGDGDVLLFDGIFLQRPELRDFWHFVVYLEASERVRLGRVALVLDDLPTDPLRVVDHVLTWVARIDRYSSGMRYYADLVDPHAGAGLVVDNNDLERPFVMPL